MGFGPLCTSAHSPGQKSSRGQSRPRPLDLARYLRLVAGRFFVSAGGVGLVPGVAIFTGVGQVEAVLVLVLVRTVVVVGAKVGPLTPRGAVVGAVVGVT